MPVRPLGQLHDTSAPTGASISQETPVPLDDACAIVPEYPTASVDMIPRWSGNR